MNIAIIIITMLMFLLGQTIQALSISMLLGVLSNLFHAAERIHSNLRTAQKSHFWHGFKILSIALLFLLINSLLQIAVWAASFFFVAEFSDFRDAFYHSAVNFATLGYGDIVMKSPWRILGAMEA
ncbi:MAG: ion channel, partial [Xenococcus sp. MO_188.B8]|nr:ion channel [Xenococcus sp. MO_188.B8]